MRVCDHEKEVSILKSEVERLKELLESHAPEGHNVTNLQYQELRAENERLKSINDEMKNCFDNFDITEVKSALLRERDEIVEMLQKMEDEMELGDYEPEHKYDIRTLQVINRKIKERNK